jgi:cytoskeleton protein RodZ
MGTMRGAPAQRQSAPTLSLAFEGESWVQVFAPDGSSLEKGLLDAGDRRTYDKGEVGRIVLGNTSAVRVLSAGEPVDLAPFSRANVARFTLSSDGSLAPVVD